MDLKGTSRNLWKAIVAVFPLLSQSIHNAVEDGRDTLFLGGQVAGDRLFCSSYLVYITYLLILLFISLIFLCSYVDLWFLVRFYVSL